MLFKRKKKVPVKLFAKQGQSKNDQERQEYFGGPPVREIQVSGANGRNVIGRVIAGQGNETPSQPMFLDYAPNIPLTPKQQHHMNYLYTLSRLHLNEVPPERRQSLLTHTTTTDGTPSGPIPFADRCEPGVKMNKHKMHGNRSRRNKKIVESKIPIVKPQESMFDLATYIECCADTLCLPTHSDILDDDEILEPTPLPGSIPIPREISFSMRAPPSIDHSFLSSAGASAAISDSRYTMVNRIESIEKRKKPTTLLQRLTMKRNQSLSVLSRVKVYVEKPPQNTDCDNSMDGSALTSPTLQHPSPMERQ
jgi:hypothetical protein